MTARTLMIDRATKPPEREARVVPDDGPGRAETVRRTAEGLEAVANVRDAWQDARQRLVEQLGQTRRLTAEAALTDLGRLAQEAIQ